MLRFHVLFSRCDLFSLVLKLNSHISILQNVLLKLLKLFIYEINIYTKIDKFIEVPL